MNRRGFLKLLPAVAALPVAAKVAEALPKKDDRYWNWKCYETTPVGTIRYSQPQDPDDWRHMTASVPLELDADDERRWRLLMEKNEKSLERMADVWGRALFREG